ncbi:hypothetical protein [Pseudoclavibacter sp. 8L]|uniref:hypothetical protein n=1 Tax=Pseudoclavibacter sp. 8L TaxID=2653162 RepID=UPI001356D69C|nr:hypothetical protein [Pseudoclavibacter sp. 8L]
MQRELVQRFLRLGASGGSFQLGVLLGEAFKGFAAEALRAAGEVFGVFGDGLSDMADAIDPPKRSDFALMPAPRGPGAGAVFIDEIQSFPPAPLDSPMANVWTLPAAEQAAIEHNQARYHELGKLRRGQPNTYNETEYR